MANATCKHCGVGFEYNPHHKRGIYCSLECSKADKKAQSDALKEQRYNDWLEGKDLGLKTPRKLIREFVIRRDGYKCNCCGITEWQGKDIALWCDHIDGNASNNNPSNFQLVCPNCDSQQDTFGAKNTGNGRKVHGLAQYG